MAGNTVSRRALELVDWDELVEIVQTDATPSIAVYVPFERTPTALHASRLRMDAHFRRLGERLRERGLSDHESDAALDRLRAECPPFESIAGSTRTLVWIARGDRVWVFESAQSLGSSVVVSDPPALRPLIAAVARSPRFRLLCVSESRVEAWEGDALSLQRVEVPEIPHSLVDALGAELDGAREISHRSDRPVPGRRANAAVYHGHGGAPEARQLDRERFHRILGPAVSKAWQGWTRPIVLAAEKRTAAELRRHLDLPTLVEEDLSGSPADVPGAELHARAVELARQGLERRELEVAGQFERARAHGKAIAESLEDQVSAAVSGRIRRLWVERDARVPGCVDLERARPVDTDDPDEDVLDALVELVLRHNGRVSAVGEGETPTGAVCCAQLR